MSVPLGLSVEVVAPGGGNEARWDGASDDPGSRPADITFGTKRGDGFAEGGCTLTRRIDGDYSDLGLYRELRMVGEDGSVAYEGRITDLPRSLEAAHSISVGAVGWMAHAKDRKFKEIYVDSDLTRWGPPTAARKAALYALSRNVVAPSTSQGANPQVAQNLPASNPPVTGIFPLNEAWYDAQGIDIGEVRAVWTKSANVTVADFVWRITNATSDEVADGDTTADLYAAAATGAAVLASTVDGRTWAALRLLNNAAFTGADRTIGWSKLQVAGRSGVARVDAGQGLLGVYASEVIQDIARRFAPKLDVSGVQPTTFPIPQVAYFDAIYPYDAFTLLNAYHLWSLSVWERKVLTFAPVDLTDYDWEVRLGDPGVSVALQGDSAQDLANGIAVTYTDVVTQRKSRITPVEYDDLRDLGVENPINKAGLEHWDELALSFPVTVEMAVQLGRARLAEVNAPKTPGTITVQGRIRDRAGKLQPVWKVRADDRIVVSSFVNDRPRLVVQTSYDHRSLKQTITVDAPSRALDAVFDRIQTDLAAANLGG